MVGFASLFLGLVLGINDIRLVTGPEVARVVVSLDGKEVGEAKGSPWIVPVDLGAELSPHELVAAAFGDDGRPLASARQWLNRPRPPAEVTVVLARKEGKRVARLSWQSLTGATPKVVDVSVDGESVPVSDAHEVVLPDVDAERVHVLRAELDFAGGVSAVADLAFGGGRTDDASARLTAVPVLLEVKAKLPAPEKLAGWFEAAGQPLAIAAVEEGPADVVVVEEESARDALGELVREIARPATRGFGIATSRDAVRSFAGLKKEQRVRVVWTAAERREHSGVRYDLFPRSDEMTWKDGGMLHVLTGISRVTTDSSPARVTDAVAVGALAAAERDRRRAVVVVLGPAATKDASTLAPAVARRYIERLRVPLLVWCVGRERDEAWGACRDVGSAGKLNAATKELVSLLERQRIVWVEGTLLPHVVALSSHASSLSLAR
jgi:stage V sporulation protein SpoVS